MTHSDESEVKPYGYDTAAIAALIKEIDVKAADNSINAAWKRYVGMALLSIATGIKKEDLIAAVFGPGAPPSKTFQNSYSIARKAYHKILDEEGWRSTSAMPVNEALKATLVAINDHMVDLSVTTKNAYDKLCGGHAVIEVREVKSGENLSGAVIQPEGAPNEMTERQSDANALNDGAPEDSPDNVETEYESAAEIPTARIIDALKRAPETDLVLVASRIIERIELRQLQQLRDDIAKKITLLEQREHSVMAAHAA